jgi:HD-GYP domain-containing protein (c-di-GMP phosphodiesterase class II)
MNASGLSPYVRWVSEHRNHALIILCGIVLTVLVAFLYLYQPLLLSAPDLKIYDTLLKLRSGLSHSGIVVIVDIDTRSLSRYGQWPWPRYQIAGLLDRLREMGARSVCVDVLFAEADRISTGTSHSDTTSSQRHNPDAALIPGRQTDNDSLLAGELRKGPFVLGYQFLFGEHIEKKCSLHPADVLIRNLAGIQDSENDLFKPSSVDCLFHTLDEATPYSGFLNIQPDRDGIIRRVPLIMEYKGRFYPHLALAAYLAATRQKEMVLNIGPAGTESLSLGKTEIPLERRGSLLIPFHGPHGTYQHVSASDVLDGRTGTEDVRDRIAIVGVVAPGLLDIHTTPTDPTMAGVEVLATIVDAIQRQDFLVRPKAAAVCEFVAIILFGFLSTFLLFRFRTSHNIVFFLLVVSVSTGATILLFRGGIYISPLYPLLVYTANFSFLSLIDFLRKEKLLKEKSRLQIATQEAMLETIANITETRDPETGGHIRRTRSYVKALAEHVRFRPAYAGIIDNDYIEQLLQAAPLHDVGKVGVPDQILLKPGRLTAVEFEEIKKHPHYGRKVFEAARAKLGDVSFLKFAAEMAFSHHERWDGTGYPNGLSGEEIPLSGRIMAIADAYDALISGRPYKDEVSHEKAVEVILAGSGTQFDPQLVEAFHEISDTFRIIAGQFADAVDIK